MDKDFDKLISLQMQIAKLVIQQSKTSIRDKVATALQFQALIFLDKNPQSTLSTLADHLRDSLSSTTQLIDRMDKAGLISRQGDKKDRRITHLSLTKKGQDNLKQIKASKLNQFKKIYSLIDKKDVKELIRIQEKLLEGLQRSNT